MTSSTGGVDEPIRSAAQVVSMRVWKVLGPVGDSARSVLDWAGLAGSPVTTQAVVAARHQINRRTLRERANRVRLADLAVPADVVRDLAQVATAGQDPRQRDRWAYLLHLPPPPTAPLPGPHGPPPLTPAEHGIVNRAVRVLAALGPRTVDDLAAAVSRRPDRRAIAGDQLAGLLSRAPAVQTDPDGRWALAEPVPPEPRDMALLTAAGATGRAVHTHLELVALLVAAGYAPASARGPVAQQHPLITRLSKGRYRIDQPGAAG